MAIAFRAQIEIRGVNPFVHVSAARARRVKPEWRKPMPVLVRVNGKPARSPWRINMMPTGEGSFYLYLHGNVRRASQTSVGDMVLVEIEFDDGYRGGPPRMPSWLTGALRDTPRAPAAWKALTPSRQKEIVRYLLNLKSEEARSRNLERVLRALTRPASAKRERGYLRS